MPTTDGNMGIRYTRLLVSYCLPTTAVGYGNVCFSKEIYAHH
jgi:hypothetical protein